MARRVPSSAAKAPRTPYALSPDEACTLFVLVDPEPTSLHPNGRVLHATASHSCEGCFQRFGEDAGSVGARAAETGQMLAYRYGLSLWQIPITALASVAEAAPVAERDTSAPPAP